MKACFSLSLTLACLLMVGCLHRHQPTTPPPAAQPTATAPKPVQAAPTAATQLPTADATRAQVAQVKPAAPGLRVSRVHVPGPYVALTFDDGPSAALTPKVLDILKRHGAHGTFFVVGQNVARNQSILARAVAEGNEVGIHTWSHIKMTGSSREKIDSEVSRTAQAVEAATGKYPVLMRPPYGATNVSIVNLMYADYGMRSILWDVDTLDWKHPGVQKVINTAVGQAKPGSIILVHDIHASTLAALDGIVTGLQARGFKLVTVSQLIALGNSAAGKSADAAPAAPAPTPAPTASTAVTAPAIPAADKPAETTETPAEPAAAAADATTEITPTAEAPAVDEWLYPTREPAPATDQSAAQ